jgi:hypothetical protein
MFAVIVCRVEPSLLMHAQAARLFGDQKPSARQLLDGPRHVQSLGNGRDHDVYRLVIRRASLTREDRMIRIQFGSSPVNRLSFDRELRDGLTSLNAFGWRRRLWRLGHQRC